jgi:hypothetical protein
MADLFTPKHLLILLLIPLIILGLPGLKKLLMRLGIM